jgi:hypothetical protein
MWGEHGVTPVQHHQKSSGMAIVLAIFAIAVFAIVGVGAAPALGAGDANTAGCHFAESSPGFRSSLPDCRAYELVSPPYADGTIAAGIYNFGPPTSPGGEQLLAISFGAFAGTEELEQSQTEYGADYEFARTPQGWTAEAQDPPASQYPWRLLEFHGVIPADLGSSVWMVEGPTQAGEEPVSRSWADKTNSLFAIREPTGEGKGRFAVLGPVVAPGHEQSFSSNLSVVEGVSGGTPAAAAHVLFAVPDESDFLWPGDGTVEGRSLYEYDGTGDGEPVLVGVRNDGSVAEAAAREGKTYLNEAAELVSECGTDYDGMSGSGNRVFFTAVAAEDEVGGQKFCAESGGAGDGTGPAVNELYARVDGTTKVETVKISGSQNAVFRGASEDGTKVFFSEGESLYEYEFPPEGFPPEDRRVTPVASGVTSVVTVAKNGERAYFESTAVLRGQGGEELENANGEKDGEGSVTDRLYVYDTAAPEGSRTAYVARGEGLGQTDTTHDGEFLLFESSQELAKTGDRSPESAPQLFEYDARSGSVARVSIGQHSTTGYECEATKALEAGYNCDGNTENPEYAPRMADVPDSSVAGDGTVVFTSELALTPGAVAGYTIRGQNGHIVSYVENVYEYSAGNLYLISPGDEPNPAAYEEPQTQTRLFGIDESGTDIFFSTADSLVPQDTDTQSSWYDARVEGGFPAPATPPSCTGQACQGALAPPPALTQPGSTTFSGEGNLAPPLTTPTTPVKKTAAQIRAEKLTKALRTCRKEPKKKRASCERAARAKYGPAKKAKKSTRRASK